MTPGTMDYDLMKPDRMKPDQMEADTMAWETIDRLTTRADLSAPRGGHRR